MFIGRGGRGGGYGPKKNYKGQRRHFTDADELQQQIERDKKQKDWRVRYIATFCAVNVWWIILTLQFISDFNFIGSQISSALKNQIYLPHVRKKDIVDW